jgi:hypothetical protein
MSGPDLSPTPDARLRTMRIVLGALCVGVVSMAAVMVWQRQAAPLPPPELPVVTFVALGFAAFMAVFSVAIPLFLQAAWRRQLRRQEGPPPTGATPALSSEEAWWARYQSRLILQAALLEGPAFFQLIAYRVEGLPVSLGVAAGLLICLLMLFPTRAGVERWVAAQRDLMEQGR